MKSSHVASSGKSSSIPPAVGKAAITPKFSAEYGHTTNGDALPVYLKKNGVTIAEMSARDNSRLKTEDALEIVRACNSHAALVAAMQSAADELDAIPFIHRHDGIDKPLATLRAALAAAKEGQP